jgi:hypothetical protein
VDISNIADPKPMQIATYPAGGSITSTYHLTSLSRYRIAVCGLIIAIRIDRISLLLSWWNSNLLIRIRRSHISQRV